MPIKLESYSTATPVKTDSGADQVVKAVKDMGNAIIEGVTDFAQRKQKRQLLAKEEEFDTLKQQTESEHKAAIEQQEARDRILAVDALGQAQREYTRRVAELDKVYVGSKTAPEYEQEKKAIFDDIMNAAGTGLSAKALKDMHKTGKSWINAQLLSDLEKAHREELEAANAAAQRVADDSLTTGEALGQAGDIAGGIIAFGMTRDELKNFADKMAANSDVPMKEYDANYMLAFLSGAAKTNPDLADVMSKPENLAGFMGKEYEDDKEYYDKLSANLRKHLEKPMEYGRNLLKIEAEKQRNALKTQEALDFMNNPIVMGAMLDTRKKDNIFGTDEELSVYYKTYKDGDKENVDENKKTAFEKIDTLIDAGATEEDAVKSVFNEYSSGTITGVDVSAEDFKNVKSIDLLKNITPAEAEQYLKDGVSAKDIIQAQAQKMYENSGKVGDGRISNADLHNVIKQVASITLNESGSVDNNLVKAFMARNYLQDHNASPQQIDVFNKTITQALTNSDFKNGIAKLANMPTFDSMLNNAWGSSKLTGIAGWFRSQKDDMTDYIENQGRNAYIEAMGYLAAGDPDTAMATYNQRIREAYDFVMSNVIDVNMVNRELERGICPIVSLNGTSVMITGRNGNGEFLIKTTGRKVNGNI